MATTTIIGCNGLHTDPSAVEPPAGAMRRAVNAVIDAPGVATARPNFERLTATVHSPDSRVPFALTQYQDGTVVVSRGVGGASGDWFLDHATTGLLSNAFEPPEITLSPTQFAQLRRNLYLTEHTGIWKMAGPISPVRAGMHAPGQLLLGLGATPESWLSTGEWVAYRVCFVKVDANDLETRSPPSSYLSIQNTDGPPPALRSVSVSVPLPDYVNIGDRLEVYRSLAVTTPPPADSMFLAVTYEVTFADISQGFVLLTDNTAPAMLGQMLYTSAGREGIEGANNPPPRGVALAAWNDSLWIGDTRYPAVLEIDLTRAWRNPSESGTVTANVTIGSPVAIVSSATDIRPGQRIQPTGVFPAGTNVLSVVGTTVTMDQSALVTNAAAPLGFWDVFVLDGLEYFGAVNADYGNRRFRVEDPLVNPSQAALRTARDFARAISRGSNGTLIAYTVETFSTDGTWPRVGRIVIHRTSGASTLPLTFNASAATVDAFDPVDPVNEFSSEPEDRPHRIAFSKPQEPEHFRPLDWIEIGRESDAVLAFAPLAGGLLVFKQDGIWSVSGTYPIFSVARVSEAVLLRGGCVDVCEDVAYAWTDRGVLAMTEVGTANNLTDLKIREELRSWQVTELLPAADNRRGNAWLCSWDSLHQVLIGACDVETFGNPFRTYCFSTLTGAWTRWDLEMRHPAYDERTGRLIYGRAREDIWELRRSLPLVRGYDHVFQLVGFLSSGTTVTIDETQLNFWAPRPGDWLQRIQSVPDSITEWRRILAVEFVLPSSWVLTIDRPFDGTGTLDFAFAREGAPATFEWQRHGITPPTTGGFLREIQAHLDVNGFDDEDLNIVDLNMRVVAGAHSDRGDALVTLVATPSQRDAATRVVRFGLPRAHGRSTHLYPYVEVNEAYRWRCLGIGLVGEEQSARVTR